MVISVSLSFASKNHQQCSWWQWQSHWGGHCSTSGRLVARKPRKPRKHSPSASDCICILAMPRRGMLAMAEISGFLIYNHNDFSQTEVSVSIFAISISITYATSILGKLPHLRLLDAPWNENTRPDISGALSFTVDHNNYMNMPCPLSQTRIRTYGLGFSNQ